MESDMNRKDFFGNLRMLPLVLMTLLLVGCGKVELLSNLPEKEVNEIMAVMQQYGIPIAKKPGVELTWTIILKNADDFSRAVKILNARGYPNVQYNSMGQIFQKSGFVSSPLEERARFMYALSESIAETLNKIPGVLTSRVHVVLPENDSYADENTEASASIFLTYKAGGNLDESVREIKHLVANSVQGLDYDRVSIALFPVAFDLEQSFDGAAYDANVSVLGLKMANDAAAKFIVIAIVLVGLSVCSVGAAVYFFLAAKKSKKPFAQLPPVQKNAPVAVQGDDVPLSELDEAEDAAEKK
jgi:type III secretion protein J